MAKTNKKLSGWGVELKERQTFYFRGGKPNYLHYLVFRDENAGRDDVYTVLTWRDSSHTDTHVIGRELDYESCKELIGDHEIGDHENGGEKTDVIQNQRRVYLDRDQCKFFQTSYNDEATATLAADALLDSKGGDGYDEDHRLILEPLNQRAVVLFRDKSDQPGWYRVEKAL